LGLNVRRSIFKIPPNLPFPKGEKHFPLLTKGDEGGLDNAFQRAKVLQILKKLDGSLLGVL
jgi:hypothetical protein